MAIPKHKPAIQPAYFCQATFLEIVYNNLFKNAPLICMWQVDTEINVSPDIDADAKEQWSEVERMVKNDFVGPVRGAIVDIGNDFQEEIFKMIFPVE